MGITAEGLGDRVRILRLNKSMTQEELAEKSGLSTKYIGELERGQSNPTLTTIEKIATALGVEMADPLEVNPEILSSQELRREINLILDKTDENTLRKIYSILIMLLMERRV